MNRVVYWLALPLALGCSSLDAQAELANTNFNLWCGDSLCNWKTEQGQIRRVGTWDEADYGVELVGTPAVISQDANLGGAGEPCLRFSILGNVQAEAQVQLELDFWNDGTVDYTEGVPGIAWHRLDLLVKLPTQAYGSMKVSLDKLGPGTAIFANLQAGSAASCEGAPIQLSHLKSGDSCVQDGDCESGHCNDLAFANSASTGVSTCAECGLDSDCDAGMVCGLVSGPTQAQFFGGCVQPHSTPNGAECNRDEQCEGGFCSGALCGECATDADCSDGWLCGVGAEDGGPNHSTCILPASVADGKLCWHDVQCASGHCCVFCTETNASCAPP